MKYKIILLIFIVFFTSCLGIQAGVNVPQTVKIGLKYGSSAVDSFLLKNDNGFRIKIDGGEELTVLDQKNIKIEKAYFNGAETYLVIEKGNFKDYSEALSYTKENKNTVVFYEDGVFSAVWEKIVDLKEAEQIQLKAKERNEKAYVEDPNDKRIRIVDQRTDDTLLIFNGQEGECLEIASKDGGTLILDTTEYRGSVLVERQQDSDMTVISKISMNEYLYSVTPSEMPASSGIEALKAQAVCARTYAVENINRHSAMGFSLCNSQHCQVYKGVSWEHARTNQAVEETDGQVLSYNGKIITAVYSASCGGVTEDVQYVWGSPYPYLKSVKDPYCKEIAWEVPLNLKSIQETLLSKGYDFGEITSIEVTERTPAGRVWKLKISGTKMTKVFEREQTRTILGLKSQFYDIVPQSSFRLLTSAGYLYQNLAGMKLLTSNGAITIKNSTIPVLTAQNGEPILKQMSLLSDQFVIKGEGNGHGVGMCQNGAMGLADNGYNYDEILKHYYNGVEITTGN